MIIDLIKILSNDNLIKFSILLILVQSNPVTPKIPADDKEILNSKYLEVKPYSNEITFIYAHGAQQYTDKQRDKFSQQMAKVHEKLLLKANKSELVYNNLLEAGKLQINPEARIYYWGDKNNENISELRLQLDYFQDYYKKFVGSLRKKLVFPLHDLVWLARSQNKKKIVQGLFEIVKEETDQGKSIVLFGHSAGSIVIYDFIIYRAPLINLYQQLQKSADKVYSEDIEFFKNNPFTCAQALLDAGVGKINEEGDLVGIFAGIVEVEYKPEIAGLKRDLFHERLTLVNKFTQDSCITPKELKGLVTFGSPLAISASMQQSDLEGKQARRLVKYIAKEGIFWLHINHLKDIIGIPISADNFVQEETNKIPIEARPKTPGFLTNNPKKRYGSSFLGAHSWYLRSDDGFSKLIIRTYEKGLQENLSN